MLLFLEFGPLNYVESLQSIDRSFTQMSILLEFKLIFFIWTSLGAVDIERRSANSRYKKYLTLLLLLISCCTNHLY